MIGFMSKESFSWQSILQKKKRGQDICIVRFAALLHDIGDWKLHNSGRSEEEVLRHTCSMLSFPTDVAEKVIAIVTRMSYSKNLDGKNVLSPEGQIVQDADRLDALGAIGIARAFAYGGKHNRELYNPAIKPQRFTSTNSYRSANGTTVNHFYEKLFLLKDLLNTKTAKEIAEKREKFMKEFMKEFYREWENKQ